MPIDRQNALKLNRLPRTDRSTDPRGKKKSVKARSSAAPPPEQTSAESFYYLKQMSSKTPMVVVLNDGEHLRGWIEWYDRAAIKLNRQDGPNLLVLKQSIKYMFKAEDE